MLDVLYIAQSSWATVHPCLQMCMATLKQWSPIVHLAKEQHQETSFSFAPSQGPVSHCNEDIRHNGNARQPKRPACPFNGDLCRAVAAKPFSCKELQWSESVPPAPSAERALTPSPWKKYVSPVWHGNIEGFTSVTRLDPFRVLVKISMTPAQKPASTVCLFLQSFA